MEKHRARLSVVDYLNVLVERVFGLSLLERVFGLSLTKSGWVCVGCVLMGLLWFVYSKSVFRKVKLL